ncbi:MULTISPECIES: glycosyltransferase domain-containing protein [Commensalibacter]|uniref:PLOD1-3-like GT domain-containing protein n=2 Tax=Commensalibacter TaxID=1079922 RepID=W7DUV7_9PROT|nr:MULTISPECIES: glycosyltransferase domain-containing protein [Commensalibacter]EUK18048.1 hypothetical protein COMX_08655 [Commensalibacter papalotli (ex Servin-Garciduenas et al. 2014)]CAI3951449.1 unnamed protein product [Commensalibacter papalotli (ex Botero et al. 2024)]CAI3955399.1 unnamed protein product [Commensalibacter papalotli (ex Botero et al. 2024)]
MIIYHLTIAAPFGANLNILKQQSIDNGFQFINISGNYQRGKVGVCQKIAITQAFLNNDYLHEDSIVLFTDGYDVNINDHYSVILNKFLSYECDMMFNVDKNFWPPVKISGVIGTVDRNDILEFFKQKTDTPNKYLNSGVYMGYVGSLRKMINFCYEASQKTGRLDDQELMQYFAYENQDVNIKLDYYDELFSAFNYSVDDFSYDGMILKNHHYGTKPSVWHGNGDKSAIVGFNNIAKINRDGNLPRYLSCIQENGKFLAYPHGGKFVFTDKINDDLCFVIQNGQKTKMCLLTSKGYILSFHPDNSYYPKNYIRNWEALTIDSENIIQTNHNVPLKDIVGNCDSLELIDVPFRVMMHVNDALLETIVNMGWS